MFGLVLHEGLCWNWHCQKLVGIQEGIDVSDMSQKNPARDYVSVLPFCGLRLRDTAPAL